MYDKLTNHPFHQKLTQRPPPLVCCDEISLWQPKGDWHNNVFTTIFLSNVEHLIFYQCIIAPLLHLLVARYRYRAERRERVIFVRPSLS